MYLFQALASGTASVYFITFSLISFHLNKKNEIKLFDYELKNLVHDQIKSNKHRSTFQPICPYSNKFSFLFNFMAVV